MSNPTNNNGQGANWQPGGANNGTPGNGQPLPPYQQGQSSTPYTTGDSQSVPTHGQPVTHETTFTPQPAQPVHGEVKEPVQPVRTERVETTRPVETPATSVGKKSGFKWWWLLPLLLIPLLIWLLWPKHPAPAPSPSATTTVATATASPTMTASASRTASPSATASASNSASASASANPFADMDKVANSIGVKCDQWNRSDANGVALKVCAQGADAKFTEVAGTQQAKLDDTFWKGFGGTYSNPGSYVVTDKSKFGFLTGSSKEEADAIAKQTQLPVYKITANGLENA